ncbi:hypothetical protein C8A01DRAFT_42521 [Parachaetomium inaequale]|uniref:HMG box domain-containing protein n=1 Tax=Parachaetomium inaequale TaxID=2588326 RepID=A0AAN6PTJ6_9PEZI|nr:hypothetical protein C8A01DRAFT_42521 [Parachaetomium inaequale]
MAPATAVPPALPPSVEEAYRRKCIQLKQRTSEVEEANDAARLRLARLKRQVEKMRLERAFLLEQLAKRTSTNVEDSDGSPSPPPTPKEKPLRIKRGHRKPSAFPANLEAPSSVNAATPGSTTFISQNLLVHSPSSDAFSAAQQGEGGKTNGVHKGAPKKPGSAFDLFCDDTRPTLKDEVKEGDNMDEELSSGWKDLPDSQRDEYQSRADRQMAEYEKEKAAYDDAKAKEAAAAAEAAAAGAKAEEEGNDKAESTESDRPAAGAGEEERTSQQREQQEQEDVEMANYDTDQETQGEKPEE